MEQRVRNTAGFYNGAGVNPAPTPVPTTDLATYRNVTWNGATVKVLCDVYGRLLVFKDTTSGRMDGVAWTDAGIDNTFDNLDQHEQAFTEIIHTYGYNDGVQAIGLDNVSINIFGTVVEFSFQDGQLVPVASQWQQGETPMFFYRTLNDGTNDVTVVCAPDGKLWVGDYDGYLIKGQNGYAWAIGAAPQALVTNAGGKVAMTAYTDEDETTIITMDGYTVVIDLDGLVTVGAINQWGYEEGLVARITSSADTLDKPTGTQQYVNVKLFEDITEDTVITNGSTTLEFKYNDFDNNILIEWKNSESNYGYDRFVDNQGYPFKAGDWRISRDQDTPACDDWATKFYE